MCRACLIEQLQYVLVDETPVRVNNEVRFEDVLIELDRPEDSVGIYTDADGQRRVLPPWAVVNEAVPRNAAITVEEPVHVTEANRVGVFGEVVEHDDSSAEEVEAADAATVIVDGDPVTIDPETTATELKQMISADEHEVFIYRDEDGDVYLLPDDEPVRDYIEPGEELGFQPGPTNPDKIFGDLS